MRVLCVGSMYPPHHLGGYELIWHSAVAHLRAEGHDVRVLASDHREPGVQEPDEPGVFRELGWYWREHEFPAISLRGRVALERANAAVLDRHLATFAPEVVSWWAMGGMSLSLIERVLRGGRPAVAFVIDDWLRYGPLADRWTSLWRRRPRAGALAERLTGVPARFTPARAARWVLASEAVARVAAESVGELPDRTILHPGVAPLFAAPAPQRPWGWRLGYVGRLEPRKGVETAVAALAALPAEATLTLTGSDEAGHRDELRALAARLGLDGRVRFTGPRPRAALPAAYAAADAIVFPVRWPEPWGLVALEAMACGRPVLATGTGGSGEYLRDGINCLLFEPADTAGLAAAARRLAGDRALRERLRAGGLATAARHTEAAFNAGVVAELERACERSNVSP